MCGPAPHPRTARRNRSRGGGARPRRSARSSLRSRPWSKSGACCWLSPWRWPYCAAARPRPRSPGPLPLIYTLIHFKSSVYGQSAGRCARAPSISGSRQLPRRGTGVVRTSTPGTAAPPPPASGSVPPAPPRPLPLLCLHLAPQPAPVLPHDSIALVLRSECEGIAEGTTRQPSHRTSHVDAACYTLPVPPVEDHNPVVHHPALSYKRINILPPYTLKSSVH